MAEGRVGNIPGREVEVGARRHDDRVLSRRLGKQGQVLAEGPEKLRGLVTAGQDDAVHPGVRDELGAERFLVELDQVQDTAGNTRFPQCLDHHRPAALGLGGRLDDHRGTGSQCGEGGPGGNGHGEVPRRRDHGELRRDEGSAVDVVEPTRQLSVEMREVDRLGNLRVRLIERLARLRRHDLHEVGPACREGIARTVQDGGALGAGEAAPA